MIRKLEVQEKLALEYLVSAACSFVVELCEEQGEYFIRPAQGHMAKQVGNFQQGQRFWLSYQAERYDSPFQAAALFVNAVRVWEKTNAESSEPAGWEAIH